MDRSSKLIFKTGNGILFPNSKPPSKNFFYTLLLILTKDFKFNFQNRIWNNFPPFAPPIKNFFYKMFLIFQRTLKLIFQTGNGIIFPTSRPTIKMNDWQTGLQVDSLLFFSRQEIELFPQKIKLYFSLPGL